MVTAQTYQILFFLLPGFLVQLLVAALHPSMEKDQFRFILLGLLYSVLIQALIALTPWGEAFLGVCSIDLSQGQNSLKVDFSLYRFVLSVVVGLLVSYVIKFDIFMRFLRFIRSTEKTSYNSTWADVFTSFRGYVTITFKDGVRISGNVCHYSDFKDEGMLTISNAAWIDDNEYVLIDVEYVLIPNISDVRTVEFHKQ